jgi:GNAT superfamily N-acetyltransferase
VSTATRGEARVLARLAVLADLPQAARLFDAYRCFQGRAPDLDASRRFLQLRFDQGDSTVLLAFLGNGLGSAAVGFAQLYPIHSSVALQRVFILNDLYVDAGHRRLGVATALLDAVEQHARALNACRLSLNVAADNATGQALYAARGWRADTQFQAFHLSL